MSSPATSPLPTRRAAAPDTRPLSVIKIGGSVLTGLQAYRRAAAFVAARLSERPDEALVVVVSAEFGVDGFPARRWRATSSPSRTRARSTCSGRPARIAIGGAAGAGAAGSGRPRRWRQRAPDGSRGAGHAQHRGAHGAARASLARGALGARRRRGSRFSRARGRGRARLARARRIGPHGRAAGGGPRRRRAASS